MKIKPTNDLLFKKMMTTTGKEYILEDFIEAVTGMKLTNVRPTNPYQIESYQKEIKSASKDWVLLFQMDTVESDD